MFKIIDRTLTALKIEENEFPKEELMKMCQLLVKLGADYIEVSIPLLERLGRLPQDGHYILRINSLEEKKKYPDFDFYVTDYKDDEEQLEDVIYEIKAQTIQELMERPEKIYTKHIRVTGLDTLLCAEYEEEEQKFMDRLKKKIDFCPKDSYYCGTALAIEWLMKGARSISVSFNGIGGYAKLEEVLMGTRVIMHKKTRYDLSVFPEMTHVYESLTGRRLYYNKAVVGKNIFNLEAGIQLEKGDETAVAYEPYDPKTVGKVRKIVIGKNSGYSAIKLKLREKGIKVPDEAIKPLLEVVRDKSMGRGRSLTDKEFVSLVREVLTHEA